MRPLYTMALHLALPWALAHLVVRSRKQPEYLAHVAERFGRYSTAAQPDPRPVIWLHAVSVGETRAAQPLVEALLAAHPDHRLLVTHMTPTGRATSEQLFGDRVERAYLPWDLPWAISAFLRHFRPRLGVVMETEIWPNLLRACARDHVPVVLANARMSERSYRRYARWRSLVADSLQAFSAVLAQARPDGDRLRALGCADVDVVGNVKFDITPPSDTVAAGHALRHQLGSRPVWLAASTREGEEALIVDALARSPGRNELLVLVPRHPQRFDEIAALLVARGISFSRRSKGETAGKDTRILLGDTMGEMFTFYAMADLAYIGGSLLPLGGQNLIEACAVGCPVLVGPHTFNFAQATEDALAAGAALRVADARELVATACRLLADAADRDRMSAAGLAFSAAHRGATARTMSLLNQLLGRMPPAQPCERSNAQDTPISSQ